MDLMLPQNYPTILQESLPHTLKQSTEAEKSIFCSIAFKTKTWQQFRLASKKTPHFLEGWSSWVGLLGSCLVNRNSDLQFLRPVIIAVGGWMGFLQICFSRQTVICIVFRVLYLLQ